MTPKNVQVLIGFIWKLLGIAFGMAFVNLPIGDNLHVNRSISDKEIPCCNEIIE